jgi:hypothetical protein
MHDDRILACHRRCNQRDVGHRPRSLG